MVDGKNVATSKNTVRNLTIIMAKAGFFEDTFEKILEQGAIMGKQSVKQVAKTFDPLQMLDKVTEQSNSDKRIEQLEKGKSQKQKHTPLDFKKLEKNYENQDKQKTDALRQRLFQLVKGGEEKTLMEGRQKEMEKKRKEAYEENEKKRKVEEKKRQEAMQLTPQGKVRRSIFSPKKVAKREQAEVKPSAGKQ